ncbi:GNAT family N-acetyltransferase [Rahnella sp. Larv3_ips]|uniref:GNAT family N-acetyltransferase n=1 Tax=Rahnella sp. Larv3_ips TaxID=1896943 RepID=UPI000EFA746C|nr:GNAT family N-acetyltransferase [Rahnella sp. Larv3_ips]
MFDTTPASLFSCPRDAGLLTLRPLNLAQDAPLLHGWMTRPYAHFWGMQNSSVAEVEAFYRDLTAGKPHAALMGDIDGQPRFLIECYPVQDDPLREHYDVQPGDIGMHILLSPADKPLPGFSWQVFSAVMEYLFSLPDVRRVVVEPDVRNEKIHTLNKRAGFRYQKQVQLTHKTAWLAFCQREDFLQASQKENTHMTSDHLQSGLHLQPEIWSRANALLLRKCLSELTHERLLAPEALQSDGVWTAYRLAVPASEVEYRFRARQLPLNDWMIDLDSIQRLDNFTAQPLDALKFIIEFAEQIGISQAMLPTYMEEISSTLYSSAYKLANNHTTARELTEADFQTVETSMTEGHPSFIANNGRIGFDAGDYVRYAPEAANPLKLVWVAVHHDKAHFASTENLPYEKLIAEELGDAQICAFTQKLVDIGVDPKNYYFMPVHPWQWQNKLLTVFAPDIARQFLIFLGEGEDQYLAQQSIRTFFNASQPRHRYVKTALSILNMGFMRGLSPYYMATTPGINEWLAELVENDTYLQSTGFKILQEVASLGYHNHYFEEAIKGDSAYKKMFAALWRENPVAQLQPNQRLMTMAALLHTDKHGDALIVEMIKSSGLGTSDWLKRYMHAYLSPLLHCFYQYDLVFMPHGENLILRFENNIPVNAFMKDIAEEIAVMNPHASLPEKAKRLAVDVPEELKILSIFTDVFAGVFRFIARILEEHGDYPAGQFWQVVAEVVRDYQIQYPELAEKFARYDMFGPEFTHSCLNRLQLANNQQMINLSDPAQNLKFAGTLENPIAAYANKY